MRKIILSILLILVMLISIVIPVYADDLSITYTLDKNTVTTALGSTVQVLLGVADIDANSTGINAITGKILFDENLIEAVDVVSVGNNWSVLYNTTSTDDHKGNIAITNMNAVKESQSIAKLIITLKSDATVTTGKVTLQNLTTSYGSTSTAPQTKVITINITEEGGQQEDEPAVTPDEPGTPSTPDTPATTPASQNTPTTSAQTSDKSTGKASTSTSKATTLPKAGIIASGIGIAILAAIIVAIIELVKYKKIGK